MAKAMRTSVSVPPELKARMDAVDEPVNWSALACRAFEDKLAEIIKRKGAKDMRDVVARLRASKEKLVESRCDDGFKAGQEWAKSKAEVEELERLESLREGLGDHEWEITWASDSTSAYCPGETFFFQIGPDAEHNRDREGAAEFWEDVLGRGEQELMSDPDFVRAFAEGALDIWRDVKDEL